MQLHFTKLLRMPVKLIKLGDYFFRDSSACRRVNKGGGDGLFVQAGDTTQS